MNFAADTVRLGHVDGPETSVLRVGSLLSINWPCNGHGLRYNFMLHASDSITFSNLRRYTYIHIICTLQGIPTYNPRLLSIGFQGD